MNDFLQKLKQALLTLLLVGSFFVIMIILLLVSAIMEEEDKKKKCDQPAKVEYRLRAVNSDIHIHDNILLEAEARSHG